MENLVFERFGNVTGSYGVPGLEDWPKYAWPDGTRRDYRPDEIGIALAGCVLFGPDWWNIVENGTTYVDHFNIIHGIIKNLKITGPATLGKLDNLNLPVHVFQNAQDGSTVRVDAFTVSVIQNPPGKYYGTCHWETVIENEECVCSGVTPVVYASAATIAPGGSINLWVNSGGLSCPDYTWTVSGTGYTLNKAVTENDLETVTLTSAGGTCGVNYGAVATVTVTDKCGLSTTAEIRNTGGKWIASGTICSAANSTGTYINHDCGSPNYSAFIIEGDEAWNVACTQNYGACWQTPGLTCWGIGSDNCNCVDPPPCGNPHECVP